MLSINEHHPHTYAEASAAVAPADMDLLLDSIDDESRALHPPYRTLSATGARNTGGDAGAAQAKRGALLRRAGEERSVVVAIAFLVTFFVIQFT
ncbi:hypothetical protein H4582DRAFT_2077136 [Lactarius indigo]|nr:hypothetical protein H4582DRAFT_2077136 [Lactarius indigo]